MNDDVLVALLARDIDRRFDLTECRVPGIELDAHTGAGGTTNQREVVDVARGDLDRVAAELLKKLYLVVGQRRRKECKAEYVSPGLDLSPLVVAQHPAAEDVVERLGYRLGLAGLAVHEDVVRERHGFVGNQPIGIHDLELDRVGAGLRREFD